MRQADCVPCWSIDPPTSEDATAEGQLRSAVGARSKPAAAASRGATMAIMARRPWMLWLLAFLVIELLWFLVWLTDPVLLLQFVS